MCSEVEPQDLSRNFNSSFGPILTWFYIVGIDLKNSLSNSGRILFRLYQYGLLLGFVLVNSRLFYELFNGTKNVTVWMKDKKQSSTLAIIYVMDLINISMHSVAVQLLLIFQTKTKWDDLQRSVEKLDDFVPPNFNVKLRKISIFGVTYCITLVQFECFSVFELFNSYYFPCSLLRCWPVTASL